MSRDPFPGWAGLPASQHGYSYAHNNPVNLTDPTGESARAALRNAWRACKGNAVTCAIGVTVMIIVWQQWAAEFGDDVIDVIDEVSDMAEHIAEECIEIVERAFQKPDPQSKPDEDDGTIDLYCDPSSPLCNDNDDKLKSITLGFQDLSDVYSLSEYQYTDRHLKHFTEMINAANLMIGSNEQVYHFEDWHRVGLTDYPPNTVLEAERFKQAAERAFWIRFSVKGIQELGGSYEGFMRKADGVVIPAHGQVTAWELRQVQQNYCHKTTFYEDGIAPSVQAKSEICGGP